jgi:pyridoxamine 5'-phosphate oxidase
MIEFNNLSHELPYSLLKSSYDKSLHANQKNIEAICISSYSNNNNEVNSRYVNLKYVNDKEFIFFSNYDSPKAIEFLNHKQISALIYWNSINLQIRMKAIIKTTTSEFNQTYFKDRDKKKNALSISSNQSAPITSYRKVIENYKDCLEHEDLKKCPKHWGGYSFIPYSFEFWRGHESRINHRDLYTCIENKWEHTFLQP